MSKTFSVAITGGIGSGKSLASQEIEKLGFNVVNADALGHKILDHQEVKDELISIFGEEILTVAVIDRKKLGEVVFNDKSKLKQLNSVLHPRIINEMRVIIRSSKEKLLFFEVALLFEAGIEDMFDLTVNVSADRELRIKRIISRDGCSEADVNKRINSQMSAELKKQRADITIENNCGKNCFVEKIRVLVELCWFFAQRK